MDDSFTKRVRTAAAAGWWAILVLAICMIAGWIAAAALMSREPQWALKLLGGRLNWDTLRTVYVWAFAALKILLWALVTLAIWLTLWARRLKKAE